jgi:hypothetical protein
MTVGNARSASAAVVEEWWPLGCGVFMTLPLRRDLPATVPFDYPAAQAYPPELSFRAESAL